MGPTDLKVCTNCGTASLCLLPVTIGAACVGEYCLLSDCQTAAQLARKGIEDPVVYTAPRRRAQRRFRT